mmetsp:Transcript_24526/g.75658  ORF Transcript_24526/g.75658 Transcript_24526/m.75658 type:complete len:177 (-) Transcript_24526:225-755(-)
MSQLRPGTPASSVLAGGAIFATGDLVAQNLAGDPIDGARVAGSAGLGAIYAGLCVPAVWHVAESLAPGVSLVKVVKKMLLTCGVLSTIGNWLTMFARRWLQVVRGVDVSGSLRACVSGVNRDIWPVIRNDLKLWPAFTLFCYAVVPYAYRPSLNALAASAWQTYVSTVSARTARGD